jgi:hypothetical protein
LNIPGCEHLDVVLKEENILVAPFYQLRKRIPERNKELKKLLTCPQISDVITQEYNEKV